MAVKPGELSDDAKKILDTLSDLLEFIDSNRMLRISEQE